MTGGPADPAELAEILARVRLVPDRYREFRRDRAEAARLHRVDAALLGTLHELGLPHARDAHGEPRYDELDLANISLALRLPSARLLAMRGWRNALESAAAGVPTVYHVDIQPRCPCPPHDGACDFELAPELPAAVPPGEGHPVGAGFIVTRPVLGGTAELSGAARAVTEAVAPLRFHFIPLELSTDLGFVRDTGLADCILANRVLVRAAREAGVPARLSYGIFLSAPYSINHCWAEFPVDGRWVAFDPHLLTTLGRLGLLDPARWPPYRSIGDAAWRIHGDDAALIRHGDRRAVLSLPTTRTVAVSR